MLLKLHYDGKEAVPEKFSELYEEKDGKYVLTGVAGIKTQEDIDTVLKAKQHEVIARKAAEEKLKKFGDRDLDQVLSELDKIEEYKLAAEGKMPDEEKIKKLLDARVASEVTPLKRQLEGLTKEKSDLEKIKGDLEADRNKRTIEDEARSAVGQFKTGKFEDSAVADILMYAANHFTLTEDGKPVTKEGIGVTPGVEAAVWLMEMAEKRPHWLVPSGGGGARSGDGKKFETNPWDPKTANRTEQMRIAREDKTLAEQMARSAGVTITGQPLKK